MAVKSSHSRACCPLCPVKKLWYMEALASHSTNGDILLHKTVIFTWQQALCSLRLDGRDKRRLHESRNRISQGRETCHGMHRVVQDGNHNGGSTGTQLSRWRKTEAFRRLIVEGRFVWLAGKPSASCKRLRTLDSGGQRARGPPIDQRHAVSPRMRSCGICCTRVAARAVVWLIEACMGGQGHGLALADAS